MRDLYSENIYDESETDEILEELNALHEKIHRLKKKKKKGRKNGKMKRLKKQIKQLEREQEQIKFFLLIYMQQGRMRIDQPQKQVGWQDSLCSSLPEFLGLATSVVNRLPDKKRGTLYLPEKK